jgi:hypothetical protein
MDIIFASLFFWILKYFSLLCAVLYFWSWSTLHQFVDFWMEFG